MKLKRFSIVFFVSFLLFACSDGKNPKDHLGEIVSVALNSIMEQDQALNSDMKFIAIDMSNLSDLNDQDKEDVLSYFKEKYSIEVMEATFEKLKEQGYYNPATLALDGVLLSIDSVKYKFNNTIFFEGSKFRSGKGAVGVECTVHFNDGYWQIKESKETWIS